MKLKNILENIKITRSNYISPDDDSLTYRQILDWLNKYRALLIRQDHEKGRTLTPFIIQELPLKLECVNNYTSNILRSTTPIPKLVEGKMKDYVTYVGRLDYEMRFTETSEQSISSVTHMKYANKYPRYFFRNDYLYIQFPPTATVKEIMLRGVFEEPQKVEDIKGNIDPFDPYDWEYPISAHIQTAVDTLIKEKEFKFTLQIPEDHENDGK